MTASADAGPGVGTGAAPFLPAIVVDWLERAPQERHRRIDGALVFVDISGFTAMSERLASLGREGAERVTEIIDGAFTSLLADAYGQGGNLLKFGGDALLLLFRDDAAAARAAHSAFRMRATLADVGSIATPAGAVQLRMSAGVHAGPVDLFLVGSSHRELLVVGPGASTVVQTEAGAGADNILLSPATAQQLPSDCVGAAHGPGRLLVGAPPVPPPVTPTANRATPLGWRALSTALRRHLIDDGRDRAEHRRAAVGFIHFAGTDHLVDQHTDASGPLHELVSTVQTAVDRRQLCLLSSDVDADGGKLIVTAGVPVSHDDDIDRMLLAMREIVDADTTIPVTIGVHRGPLFAGEVGPPYRRTYTVMGDVVNTAARVMSRAAHGEVLVTIETLDDAALRFDDEPIEPFHVKGKTEPLHASRLGHLAAEVASLHGTEPTHLIGRETEVADLLARLDRAVSGVGSSISLVGPPGVGKTALLRAVVDVRPDVDVIVLRCQQATQLDPYGPVTTAFRGALGVALDASRHDISRQVDELLAGLRLDLADGGAALRVALGVSDQTADDLDAVSFRANVAEAFDKILCATYPDGLLLAVENGQWIDEPSARLVDSLADRSPRRPWLIASTTHGGEELSLASTRRVEPLDELNATEMALVASHHRLLPPEANDIAKRAQGNPLFVKELVGAVIESGRDAADLPATLETMLASRVDRLEPASRALLRRVAVLGVSSPAAEVADFLGSTVDELVEHLAPLRDFLLVDESVVRFRETLLLDAAYGGLTFRLRRELHGLAGTRLESRLDDPFERPDTLARHFEIAGDAARTWRYACAAGDRARTQTAYGQAASQYERALRAARRRRDIADAERGRVLQHLGSALMNTGRQADSERTFTAARRLLSHPHERAQLAVREGMLARELGSSVLAVRRYRRALRLFDQPAPEATGAEPAADATIDAGSWRCRALVGLAIVRFEQGRLRESEELLGEALDVAATIDDGGAQTAVASLWLFQLLDRQRRPGAEVHGLRALQLFERQGKLRLVAHTRNALGNHASSVGQWDTAVAHGRNALDVLQRLGLPVEAAVVQFNLAVQLYDQGHFDAAAPELDAVARVLRTVGHPWTALVEGTRACASARAGDADADELVRIAVGELDRAGRGLAANDLLVQWAEALCDRGRFADAQTVLDQLAGRPPHEPTSQQERLRARIAHDGPSPDPAAAEAHALASLSLAGWGAEVDDPDDPYQLGLGLAVAAQLGLDDRIGADLAAASRRLLDPLGVVAGAFGQRPERSSSSSH